MDIKRLTHFIALAEERRFVAAAARMHLSQAAFSRSIQALEDQLGLRLFDRGPQGVALTQVGETVLQRAKALVFESRCLDRDIELLKSGDGGEITLGAAPIPAATILPELLQQLQLQSPRLVCRVRFGNLPILIEQLEAQEIDFCLGDPRLIGKSERHASVAVGRQMSGLYCRAGHPLACKGSVSAEALRDYGIARISISPELLGRVALALGFASHKSLPLTVECDDIQALAQLVANTDVLGILPEKIASRSEFRLHNLFHEGASTMYADVHAIWLKRRTLSPAAARAIDLARKISQNQSYTD